MWVSQGRFSCCWAGLAHLKAFSASHPTPPRRLGVHKELGGDTAGTAAPNWPKGYCRPYETVWKRRKGETFGVMTIVFPSHCYTWWALLSWRTGLDAPSPGETENEFLILVCLCTWLLLSPLHCLYLKPPNYFIIYSCNSLSHYTWVELVSGSVGLICQLGLNHKSYLLYQYWRQIKLKNIVVFI